MSTRYDTFVTLAGTLQWDETAIDFAPDTRAWPMLDDAENAQVLGLIAGFCIAESAVSGHLGSFQAAASEDSVAACFRAQARDEHRHARFFDRVAAEVAAVPGADITARQDVLRTLVSPDLVALFEERLPATARRLAEDREGLTAAVGLYHMVLEGVVLLAGQNAMLDVLDRLSARLPGVRRGVELVLRDERWHIGFGTRLVRGAGLGRDEVEALLALGQAAARAWGALVSPGAADRAVRMHRSRLRALDVKFFLSLGRAPEEAGIMTMPRAEDWRHRGGHFSWRPAAEDACPVEIFHVELGDPDASVLLLIHGWPTSSIDWFDVAGQLSAGFRVCALDFPGYGR